MLVNGTLLILLSVPCVLGLTDWSGFTVAGKNIMDLEDFIVSNNLLPLGSVVYLLFCVSRYGWGWDNFIREAICGKRAEVPGLQGGPVLPDLHPSADHPGDFHPGILEYDRRIKIFSRF